MSYIDKQQIRADIAIRKSMPGFSVSPDHRLARLKAIQETQRSFGLEVVEALLDELEAKDKLNAELMEKQRLIDICQGQGLEHRIAAEKRAEAAEKRASELECITGALRELRPGHITIAGEKIGIYMRDEVDAALNGAAAGKGEAS
ncbi:hypothetical protein [Enterobacter ludwigii]|uniref:hypothetical protein n=1 Tax=Enterobacter ludwigii TaxID=299767 RepID=UPI0005CFE01A|nr:hypothetical protein [Enterobacter ludwigii]